MRRAARDSSNDDELAVYTKLLADRPMGGFANSPFARDVASHDHATHFQ